MNRLWYTFSVFFPKKVRQIKQIQQKNYARVLFSEADHSFLLACLQEENSDDVYTAALIAFTEAMDQSLDVLVDVFSRLSLHVRLLAIPMLACTDYVACYRVLLEQLRITDSLDEVTMLSLVLSSTEYLIEPLLVYELITDDAVYMKRLGYVLKKVGFKRVGSYLALHPQIPFESFFRNLFGDGQIDKIKQRN